MRAIPTMAGAAILAGALVASSAGQAGAVNGIPKAAGFHLSGEGNVIPLAVDGQHVRAADGTEHIFAYSLASGDDGGFLYETRAPGATAWTKVRVPMPDSSPQHETPGTSLEVSADGTNVHAFITTCTNTYILEAPVDSTALGSAMPVPGAATTLCPIEGPPLITEIPTSGDDDLYLFRDGSTASGPPGGSLAASDKIPGVGKRKLLALTRDSVTGELAALAEVPGRADHSPVSVWTKPASGSWSKRTVVTHLNTPGHDISTATMASHGGQILVGLDTWVHGHGLHRNGVKVVSRNRKGKWSTPARLPHTNHNDSEITLTADPVTGRIVTTYLQYTLGVEVGKGDGLLMEQRINGRWHKPTHVQRLKKARYLLTTTSVSFDGSGKPTVGFIYDD